MSFVSVPAAAIRERLAAAGFKLLPAARGEEVYERRHDKDSRYTVKVYSSIQRGASEARGRGTDAIRVVALFKNTGWNGFKCIHKAKRVHRSGSVEGVLERMIERAREAYGYCNGHRQGARW